MKEIGRRAPIPLSALDPRALEGEGPPRGRADDDGLPTWRRVLPWTLLGGAVLSGSVGVWQHLQSSHAKNSFDSIAACGASSTDRGNDPRCAGLYDDFQSARTHAYIGYAVAAVLGASAVTTFILNATSSPGGAGSFARDRSGHGRRTIPTEPSSPTPVASDAKQGKPAWDRQIRLSALRSAFRPHPAEW